MFQDYFLLLLTYFCATCYFDGREVDSKVVYLVVDNFSEILVSNVQLFQSGWYSLSFTVPVVCY